MQGFELPGFANVHSHAFQRGLRGGVQQRELRCKDTFWSWRERMYTLAQALDVGAFEALARLCFVECLEAGYTAIGEFHYMHHRVSGRPYADPIAMARALLRAAEQTGIRLTLLWTVYARGGFELGLNENQRRFGTISLDEVWRALDALQGLVDGEQTRLGLAIHSVRAVPRQWFTPLAEAARARQLPLHAHVSEQKAEVVSCQAATGLTPVALLHGEGVLSPGFTAVHATWLSDADIRLLATSGATVALCPTTEGDLGDGVPRTADLHAAGVPLAIGSDSHAVIDPFCELRMMEYQARAATQTRCVVVDGAGAVARGLQWVGHDYGYRCLGLRADGDRVRLRSDATTLRGCSDLLAAAMMAGHPGLIDEVTVAGDTVVRGGRHVLMQVQP